MKSHQKPLKYEAHALKRMHGRQIAKIRVVETIRNYDRTRPAKRPGALIFEKKFGSAILKVVAEETATFIRVISAWIK